MIKDYSNSAFPENLTTNAPCSLSSPPSPPTRSHGQYIRVVTSSDLGFRKTWIFISSAMQLSVLDKWLYLAEPFHQLGNRNNTSSASGREAWGLRRVQRSPQRGVCSKGGHTCYRRESVQQDMSEGLVAQTFISGTETKTLKDTRVKTPVWGGMATVTFSDG